ncbi:MAG TPA: TetR/AcrR family transcriptional regulator [Polyangiaceae bacterium]|nr:TetR/AcrR family transcriptional regulator [Polyangiaceae bacterium]
MAPPPKDAAAAALPRSSGAEQLLDAAIELIATHGYAGMSVDALCRKAGVVKSGLYWHYGSKEGVLLAALERVTSEWIEGFEDSVHQGGEALERLDRTLAGLQRRIIESPEGLAVMLVVLLERSAADPEMRELLQRQLARVHGAVMGSIVDALGFDLPDKEVIASLMLAMFHGSFVSYMARQDKAYLERMFGGMREALVLLITQRLPALCPPTAQEGNHA